jgi:hypothetical protein
MDDYPYFSEELIALRQLSHPSDWEAWSNELDEIRALPSVVPAPEGHAS